MPIRALIRDADAGRWLAFRDPVAVLSARLADDVPAVLAQTEALRQAEGLYAVGFLTYEAAVGLDHALAAHAPGCLPPAWFALFADACAEKPPQAPRDAPPLHWRPSIDDAGYRDAIARIRDDIAAGDTYQVNFSYRLDAAVPDADAAWTGGLFAAMVARQPAGYGAWIDTDEWAVCSASHELFFAQRGTTLISRPMKGTAPRGRSAAEDAMLARWLRGGLKNRAENLMITDMVRNDLGRIARIGSVRTLDLFRLEPYPTLWQMTSTVRAESDAALEDIVAALFPAASITGAPKRRTMEIIRELEARPREIYTGSIGLLRPDGSAQFNVAIRTALVDKPAGRAEYGVGGGVLWDSTADSEYRETLTKARILHTASCGNDAEPFDLLETLLWRPDEGFWLLDAHLERLAAAAAFFGIVWNRDAVLAALDAACRGLAADAHRVRLLLATNGQATVEAAPLSQSPPSRCVAVSTQRLPLEDDPFVLHKTTRRDVYRRAFEAAVAEFPDAEDVLLVNERGEVTESTIANLLVQLDGRWVTPPVCSGLLPGVYRRCLLEVGEVTERAVTPDMLARAEALHLANSVRGRWPVRLVNPSS